jgi:hypothetical protein
MVALTLLKLALLCAVARVEAHTIMQRVAVNGVSEPNLVGVRAPFYNDVSPVSCSSKEWTLTRCDSLCLARRPTSTLPILRVGETIHIRSWPMLSMFLQERKLARFGGDMSLVDFANQSHRLDLTIID